MKKFQIVFLLVFLVGCSPSPEALPLLTPGNLQTPSLAPAQTTIPPTEMLTPMPTFTPPPTSTAISGGGGKIAFTSERDGYPEIYVMNVDGSDPIKLANDITPKFNPAWSPDGTKIAFGSSDNDTASIYIMNADGSNPAKLIDTKEIDTYDQATSDWRFATGCCNPVWSPDAEKVAFRIMHYVGCCALRGNIYIINADGSNLISTAIPAWAGPVWSPDSQKIAFSDGFINSDGTNVIDIGLGSASWSPDGKKIAFAAGWGGDAKVYVMNADGTNPVNLTDYASPWDHGPVWSPDGKKIAFISYRDGNYEIYAVNADGTDLVNLTKNPADEGAQAWSPDSTKIAFVSNSEIYVVDADGSNLLRLTDNDAEDYSPVWSP